MYPQTEESNEYRYIDNAWLDELAVGLTAGAKTHPGETWRDIPAKEHMARALRHINLYLKGDRTDNHIINASMRCMMAFALDRIESDVELQGILNTAEEANLNAYEFDSDADFDEDNPFGPFPKPSLDDPDIEVDKKPTKRAPAKKKSIFSSTPAWGPPKTF